MVTLTEQQRRDLQHKLERRISQLGIPVVFKRPDLRDSIAVLDDHAATQESVKNALLPPRMQAAPPKHKRAIDEAIAQARRELL